MASHGGICVPAAQLGSVSRVAGPKREGMSGVVSGWAAEGPVLDLLGVRGDGARGVGPVQTVHGDLELRREHGRELGTQVMQGGGGQRVSQGEDVLEEHDRESTHRP